MNGFKEKFTAYGADYTVTMERFLGNEAMYLRLLDMLFEDQSLRQLADALGAGDIEGAFAAAHTLKGIVGNMGLTPLYQAVCILVEPLRAGEQRGDYLDLYQAVENEFQRADLFRRQLKETGE